MKKEYYTQEWELKIIEACATFPTMAQACSALNMNLNTFTYHAKRLNVYSPNKGGKGTKKCKKKIYATKDILEGKFPQYNTYKLKNRLLKENIKEYKCENCGLSEWLEVRIPLELHHIDGNSNNHKLKNLQMLCPNCHALTENYRALNKKQV